MDKQQLTPLLYELYMIKDEQHQLGMHIDLIPIFGNENVFWKER